MYVLFDDAAEAGVSADEKAERADVDEITAPLVA